MSFVQQTPRDFTRENVEAIRPNLIGVYGLFRQDAWIYVGKGDIRKRLLDHLNNDNPAIAREKPTHWVDEIATGDPSYREKALILELNPICNRRVG